MWSIKKSFIEKFSSRHLAERQRLNRVLQTMVELSSLHGDAFFRALIQATISILEMRFAFVAECVEGARTRVRTLAYWRAGEFIDNLEFAVEGTPCKDVVEGAICYYPEGLRKFFPENKVIAKMGAESYCSVPLSDVSGNVIGHLVVMDNKPLGDKSSLLPILNILAARASLELERKQSGEKLRWSASLLDTALESTSDGIVATNRHGDVVRYNQKFLRMWNIPEWTSLYSERQMVATMSERLKDPRRFIDRTLQDDVQSHATNHEMLELKNGKILESHVRSQLIDDQPVGVVWGFRDVTAHKQTETKLDRQTRHLAALDEMAGMVLSSLELDVVLAQVIGQLQTLLNAQDVVVLLLDDDEFVYAAVGGVHSQALLNQRIPSWAGVAGEVLRTGKGVVLSDEALDVHLYEPLQKITVYRAGSILAAPIQFNDRLIGVLEAVDMKSEMFTTDDLDLLETASAWAAIAINNARQHESLRHRLQESEALAKISNALTHAHEIGDIFQLIVDVAMQVIPKVERAVIHHFDSEKNILYPVVAAGMNEAGDVNLTMRLGEGIAGNAFLIGSPINVHDVKADSRYVPTGTSTPLRSLMASPIQHEENRWGTLSVQSAAPHAFSDDDERLLNTLAMQAALAIEHAHLHDGLKRALEQEKAMREQAIQSAKLAAMGRLLASVAHELNNPLQALQNALFLAKQDAGLHPQTRQDLEAASAEAESMAELISRLREAYRLAPGDHAQPESIAAILHDVLRLIGTYLRHSEISFEFESDPALPLVLCNRNQLRQVFLNLCLNAVEAMKGGGKLTVCTSYKSQRAEVLVAITDTGIGIHPSTLSNIFEPFFTTKESGTGLGLSIVYEIVQNHNGKIEVESKAGVGTTFKVWLPVGKNL